MYNGRVAVIADTLNSDYTFTLEEDRANIYRMAAAPDLLEACKYCLDMLKQSLDGETVAQRLTLIGGCYAEELLTKAIAKAELKA